MGGEETRKSPPLVRGVYFSVYNRGKKSLCLDLRTERGKEVFAALVKTADIVLQTEDGIDKSRYLRSSKASKPFKAWRIRLVQ